MAQGKVGGLIKSNHTRPILILLFFCLGLLLYDILAFQIFHIYSRVVACLIVVDQLAQFISYACDVYIFCLWYYVIFVDTFLSYGLAGCAFIRGDIVPTYTTQYTSYISKCPENKI
jgi:hypothetical protein